MSDKVPIRLREFRFYSDVFKSMIFGKIGGGYLL